MRKITLLTFFTIISTAVVAQNISERLFHLPDVIFKKIETPLGYDAAYEMKIKQPLDHEHPEKGYFYQRAYLSHAGYDKPTVMVTNGYAKSRNSITEPAELLGANQISIEHRYFGKSVPDSINYQYLTLEQVAEDLHYINQLFREIYSGKWISTGISKGGQTTMFYRYAFPKDVDVSIPYVAPSTLGLEDRRIYTFLDTVGSDTCRMKLKAVQIKLLTEREKVLPLLKWYTYGAKLNFNYLKFEEAFEYAVLEYPFSFWQWGSNCNDIPSATESLEDILYHFVTVSGIDFFADKSMEQYASHYYQAGSQMGYYGYDISAFNTLLKALPQNKNPSAVFMPNKMEVEFNNSSIIEMQKWLRTKGNQMIYINGNKDTWSVTAERPVKGIDALWFFLDGKDHGAARIKNMNSKERELLVNTLEGWLEIEIE